MAGLQVAARADITECSKRLVAALRTDANVQAVGVGDGMLLIYLIKKSGPGGYPVAWEGWPVETRVSGRMVLAGS